MATATEVTRAGNTSAAQASTARTKPAVIFSPRCCRCASAFKGARA